MKKQLTPEQLEKNKEQWKKVKKPLIIIGGLFLLLFLFMNYVQSNTQERNMADNTSVKVAEEERSSKITAYLISQEFVKHQLDFPEEADFPFLAIESFEYQDNIYTISSEVTGKNAFGVKIKKRYSCQLQYLGGEEFQLANWKKIELQFF